MGINSYIVGCKLYHMKGNSHPVFELIVTQWDVNKEQMYDISLSYFELIVTQWDVNLATWPIEDALPAN